MDYKPGEKIPVQDITEEFGVSRIPLREALLRLANEGLLEYYPNKGAFAKQYSKQEIREIFEMRILIETYALENVDSSLLEENRNKITQLCEMIQKKITDRSAFIQIDERVHEMIVSLHGNHVMFDMYRMICDRISMFRSISVKEQKNLELANKSHISFLRSILNGDYERAKRNLTRHLTESMDIILDYYELMAA